VCGLGPAMKQREKVVPHAFGHVLEIGAGSGLNFSYYDADKVDHLFALDPSSDMLSIAERQLNDLHLRVELIQAVAEEIPLETNSIDSIVITYTLCSIPDVDLVFPEFKRVLKPTGKLIFCEHGRAPDHTVRKWQNLLNPVWKHVGGGCNLNRDIPQMIKDGDFAIQQLNTMYIPGFKPACYNFWGTAHLP
ncbi:MAG: class I SAM-dependent methyltransferase, partial [Bacteroidia bacterium]|nr:class I SAM-dependent methyltransferase [Bacteroidia bacterium]